MEELIVLRERVGALLKKYKALQKSHTALLKEHDKREKECAALSTKLQDTEAKLMAAEAGIFLKDDDDDKARIRKSIDSVIGEIDKILTSIND